jgi:hypothetical protein
MTLRDFLARRFKCTSIINIARWFAAQSPAMMWWGGRFNDSAAAYWGRMQSVNAPVSTTTSPAWGAFAENFLYFSALGSPSDIAALPLNKLYDLRYLAVFRSEWNSADGNFLGLKGGDNTWNHGHLDAGTCVWDVAGIRVLDDLGADSYSTTYCT